MEKEEMVDIHSNNPGGSTLVRLHEKRMNGIDTKVDKAFDQFHERVRDLEKDVKKIPYILLVVIVNILLTGVVLFFNIGRGIAH